MIKKKSVVLSAVLSLAATPVGTAAQAAASLHAEAEVQGCTDAAISGQLYLDERPSSEGVKQVDVVLKVRGLPDGLHAVHIHETGSCKPCGSAGGHFDPGPASLTNPDGNHPFHLGDLVNIRSRGGFGLLRTTSTRFTLSPGPLSLFDADGSAVIIHTDPDTYCPNGPEKGCAGGARAACGVIKRR